MGCTLALDSVTVVQNKRAIVDQVSLNLESGKIGCLLGPSGSGKTTILRCIAGFQKLDSGNIYLADNLVSGYSVHMPSEKRKVGMVFQDYALFPHLTVAKNIVFGISHLRKSERMQQLDKMLTLVELESKRDKYPHELSGGQQQRVALARALASEPELLLLDEPFSSIDASFRLQLAQDVRSLLLEHHITALLITHSQEEAFAMSDMLGILDKGNLLQWNNTYDVYHKPNSRKVATFIGMGSMLKGKIKSGGFVETSLGNFSIDKNHYQIGKNVNVLIRPDDIIHDDQSRRQAVIDKKQFRGPEFLYQLRLKNEETVYCFAPSHHNHHVGESIGITIDVEHVIIFPEV